MKLAKDEGRVVTHSSGNHAQALSLAAKLNGIEAWIVMPENSPAVKKRAVEGYGGRIFIASSHPAEREQMCVDILRESGGVFVHPSNDLDVIAGQGTLALELLQQVPDLDAIVVPVGGGVFQGVCSGVCVAAKGINPNIRIYGAEPKNADDAMRSLETGILQPQNNPNTIADGLRTCLGSNTFPIMRALVDRIFTVPEDAIRSAMRDVWERMKVVVEPSAAVGVAVVLSEDFKAEVPPEVRRVAVVFTGGNLDLDTWKW